MLVNYVNYFSFQPLLPEVAVWIESFVARHHVERPFHKRRRDRADPEALAFRPRVPSTRESSDV